MSQKLHRLHDVHVGGVKAGIRLQHDDGGGGQLQPEKKLGLVGSLSYLEGGRQALKQDGTQEKRGKYARDNTTDEGELTKPSPEALDPRKSS